MKFKHGVIAGFVGCFVIVCGAIAARETEQEEKFKRDRVDYEHAGYSRGFRDGTAFYTDYHRVHHPECGRCPH